MQGERLFVAVPLHDAVRQQLAAALPENIPGRRVAPEKWHFTLQFIGDTAPDARDRVIAALGASSLGGGFDLRLAGLGAYPRPSRARVLWVGVERGAERLKELAHTVATACARAGLIPDMRPYSPHVTISRLDPPGDARAIIAAGKSVSVAATADAVLLVRSTLGRGPARYESLARFPLVTVPPKRPE
jgi:2'-5' RNA ligase